MLVPTHVLRTAALSLLGLAVIWGTAAAAQEKKPNILVIWGDDIGPALGGQR